MNKTILDIAGRYDHRGRRSGNTTRMIDAAIQLLFEGNKVIYITNIPIESETFLKRLMHRFHLEHGTGAAVVNQNLPHLHHWESPRFTKRLLIQRTVGEKTRGITYFDKDDKPQDIDGLHHTEIAVIIELQTIAEYDELKTPKKTNKEWLQNGTGTEKV